MKHFFNKYVRSGAISNEQSRYAVQYYKRKPYYCITKFTANLNYNNVFNIHYLFCYKGFGIYPTNRTGVVSIHAWHGGNGGKMVSMLVDVKNGTILSTEIHTDFTKIMCYGNSVNRTMNKRSTRTFFHFL